LVLDYIKNSESNNLFYSSGYLLIIDARTNATPISQVILDYCKCGYAAYKTKYKIFDKYKLNSMTT